MREFFYLVVFEWAEPGKFPSKATRAGTVSIGPGEPTHRVTDNLIGEIKATDATIPSSAIVVNLQFLPQFLVGNVE